MALRHALMDEAFPILVDCLRDPDEEIRREVLDALYFRTHEDFDFLPEATEFEREKAIQKWHNWLKTLDI
ncbi:MAG: HEAT repeat domain-containing protein [Planctomycetota bacterium]